MHGWLQQATSWRHSKPQKTKHTRVHNVNTMNVSAWMRRQKAAGDENVLTDSVASFSRPDAHANANVKANPSCVTSQRNFWTSYVVLCLGQIGRASHISALKSSFVQTFVVQLYVAWFWWFFKQEQRSTELFFWGPFWVSFQENLGQSSDSSKTRGFVPKVAFALTFSVLRAIY